MLTDHENCFDQGSLDEARKVLLSRGWRHGFCVLGTDTMHYVCAHDGGEVMIYPHDVQWTGCANVDIGANFVCVSLKTGNMRFNSCFNEKERIQRDAFRASIDRDLMLEIAHKVSGHKTKTAEVPWFKKTGNADKEYENA
ncbi:MAG TPA: hypothetical protein PL106_01040 [Flavobacteriales bacterium]|nr:hypothetical protein [Flavobacteriales bacterium]